MTQITCFDGVGCIGGNKILLEDGQARLFFDFGKNFGAEGDYYEEFIKPKSLSGIYEPVQMGLLPAFRDLYRDDMISESFDPWQGIATQEIGEVGGVLVSHAHVDHIGSLHHLRVDIPIYCSPMTAAISKAFQDTAAGSVPGEYCYYVCRTDGAGGLSTPPWKTHPYAGKKYHLTEPVNAEFTEFWNSVHGGRKLEALECETASKCAGLNLKSFPVDHSIYGATAWAVETAAGWVVYAGDLRMHGTYGDYTTQFVQQAAALNPVALILEGTRITSNSTYTETSVKEASLEAVKKCNSLVIADFGPRNVERLVSFLEIARETGRELAILPKDAYLLEAMKVAGSTQSVPDMAEGNTRIYREYSSSPAKWQAHIFDEFQHLLLSPAELNQNQDKFIVCLSFFDVNELPYIRPADGSIWLSSNCEAFNEEMQIDEQRLRNWLDKFGIEFVSGGAFHVSGHASGSDLEQIVRTIQPKTLIPVHTEHPELFVEKVGDVCTVHIAEKGLPITV